MKTFRLSKFKLALFFIFLATLTLGWIAHDSTRLHVKRLIIPNNAFAQVLPGKKLVFISDTHFDKYDQQIIAELLEKLRAIRPDFIFVAGDMVRWYGRRADYELVFSFLKKLRATNGVFAVMGDSDYAFPRASCGFCHDEKMRKLITLNRTQFIRDSFFDLNIENARLRIAGIDCGPDVLPDLTIADSLCHANIPTILLSHTSTVFDTVSSAKNVLVLAGDTHGGQVYLPDFAWKIWQRKPDPGRMYGFFRDGNKMLYVTSGVGTSDVVFRLGVPAEVAVIEFVSETETQATKFIKQ